MVTTCRRHVVLGLLVVVAGKWTESFADMKQTVQTITETRANDRPQRRGRATHVGSCATHDLPPGASRSRGRQ